MPLDYSKWKKIEVSDDEDDTHPNIDTPSLFRWRHRARLERMAERKEEKEKLNKEKSTIEKRMQVRYLELLIIIYYNYYFITIDKMSEWSICNPFLC